MRKTRKSDHNESGSHQQPDRQAAGLFTDGALPDGTPSNPTDFQLGSRVRAEPSGLAATGTAPEQILVMTLNEDNVWEYMPEGSTKESARATVHRRRKL